jgi:hypothetical protein
VKCSFGRGSRDHASIGGAESFVRRSILDGASLLRIRLMIPSKTREDGHDVPSDDRPDAIDALIGADGRLEPACGQEIKQ